MEVATSKLELTFSLIPEALCAVRHAMLAITEEIPTSAYLIASSLRIYPTSMAAIRSQAVFSLISN